MEEPAATGSVAVIAARLIALAAALGSAGAARAEVIEVGEGGTVKVLSDMPNATWSSGETAMAQGGATTKGRSIHLHEPDP